MQVGYNAGELVRVSGEVRYGGQDYRVSSEGTVIERCRDGSYLVRIGSIDGDCNAVCAVPCGCIYKNKKTINK